MNWDRSTLKERAKERFKQNYWKCVLVAVIMSVAVGSGGNAGISKKGNSDANPKNQAVAAGLQEMLGTDIPFGSKDASSAKQIEQFVETFDFSELQKLDFSGLFAILIAAIVAAVVVAIIAMIVKFVLDVFVFNPLSVGGYRFFVNNISDSNVTLRELGYGFQSGRYGNIVKTLFFRELFIGLWSMLFIIPGIIKAYEYRMIPFLLADNPMMDSSEAFAKSKQMMDGQKWDTFVLDLSFIGWHILGKLTFGILEAFYVQPYVQATNAELYLALGGSWVPSGYQGYQNNQGAGDGGYTPF